MTEQNSMVKTSGRKTGYKKLYYFSRHAWMVLSSGLTGLWAAIFASLEVSKTDTYSASNIFLSSNTL